MRRRLLFAPLVAAFVIPSLAAAHVRHTPAPAATVQRQGATPTPVASTAAPAPTPAAASGDSTSSVPRYLVTGIVLVTLGAMVVVLAILWWRAG